MRAGAIAERPTRPRSSIVTANRSVSLLPWVSSCWRVTARRSGASTGATRVGTDLPLTENGRRRARALADLLAGRSFALVITSPLRRALETCELAGLGGQAQVREDLHEWDYGDYEGADHAPDPRAPA